MGSGIMWDFYCLPVLFLHFQKQRQIEPVLRLSAEEKS